MPDRAAGMARRGMANSSGKQFQGDKGKKGVEWPNMRSG